MSTDARKYEYKSIMNYTGAKVCLLYLQHQLLLFEELYLINFIINKEQLNNLNLYEMKKNLQSVSAFPVKRKFN